MTHVHSERLWKKALFVALRTHHVACREFCDRIILLEPATGREPGYDLRLQGRGFWDGDRHRRGATCAKILDICIGCKFSGFLLRGFNDRLISNSYRVDATGMSCEATVILERLLAAGTDSRRKRHKESGKRDMGTRIIFVGLGTPFGGRHPLTETSERLLI
jgi:hypothetical protein